MTVGTILATIGRFVWTFLKQAGVQMAYSARQAVIKEGLKIAEETAEEAYQGTKQWIERVRG